MKKLWCFFTHWGTLRTLPLLHKTPYAFFCTKCGVEWFEL